MDNRNIEHKGNRPHWGGVVLIVIGLFLFLQNLHLAVPYWVFSWKMLLIVLGLVVAVKHKFRGGPWFIMILIGAIFLSEELFPWKFFDSTTRLSPPKTARAFTKSSDDPPWTISL
ncbi:MAG TPA: DUF5668 domain-containing protein [Chitinophaga sp.]